MTNPVAGPYGWGTIWRPCSANETTSFHPFSPRPLATSRTKMAPNLTNSHRPGNVLTEPKPKTQTVTRPVHVRPFRPTDLEGVQRVFLSSMLYGRTSLPEVDRRHPSTELIFQSHPTSRLPPLPSPVPRPHLPKFIRRLHLLQHRPRSPLSVVLSLSLLGSIPHPHEGQNRRHLAVSCGIRAMAREAAVVPLPRVLQILPSSGGEG